jgi:hypothetical protein
MTYPRRARLGMGALMIGIPASAAALGGAQALAAPAPEPLQITPHARHIAYGHELVLEGTTSPGDGGHQVALQFQARRSRGWRQLTSATVGGDGRFRLAAPLTQSGAVRALDLTSGSLTPLLAGRDAGAGAATSNAVPVQVAARLRIRGRQIAVLGSQAVEFRGRLLPGVAGRKVSLQGQDGSGWRTVATARTRAAGWFVLRYSADTAGREKLRVRFGGDRWNARTSATAGQITVYREAGASWYNDSGNTACGFHARYGVANRTLPCGATVSLRYNGRAVTATVDDRGPYVGGRDWDLNQNTAAALGFGGVGTVWSSR